MRTLAVLLAAGLAAGTAPAATFVYVSAAADKQIRVYRADPADGSLKHVVDVTMAGEPGALTTDPKRQFLFAAVRSAGDLAAYRIDPKTGRLTHLNTVPAGADPAHVATDRTGRFLLAAYYQAGKVTVHAIGEDGKLGAEPLQSVPTAKMAHAVAPDTSNRWVFVPHTGPNAIFQFAFDPEKGRLMANPTAAKVTTPENTGPRHLAWHPTLPVAYVENEQGSGVTAWSFDARTGTLAPGPTASSLPADFKGVNSGAEVKAHPSGKFLYSSNRGHDSIAVYRLDEKGKPDTAGQEPTEKTPRSFDLDPSGSFLYAAGEGSGKLACYRIDRETGRLKRFATEDVGAKAWWVMAVELPGE